MESLSPALSCALHLRWEMENGASFRESLRHYLRIAESDGFVIVLRDWCIRKSHDQDTREIVRATESAYRRALLLLFDRGWRGEPILEALQELENEIREACQAELDHFVATLPFRGMAPLLFFQFPAYLLLLIGPALTDLTRSLN